EAAVPVTLTAGTHCCYEYAIDGIVRYCIRPPGHAGTHADADGNLLPEEDHGDDEPFDLAAGVDPFAIPDGRIAPPDGTPACTCTDPECPDPVHQEPASLDQDQ